MVYLLEDRVYFDGAAAADVHSCEQGQLKLGGCKSDF